MTTALTIRPMPPAQAWGYAATWGSFMKSGDPGACMYGFDETFAVQHEDHRQACLTWVEGCRADVRRNPTAFERNELDQLTALEGALRSAPTDEEVRTRLSDLDEFTRAYIAAALWSTNDNSDEETGGDPFDANYGPSHIHPTTLARMVDDCRRFQRDHAETLARCGGGLEQAGHDFWLTRNRHGVGFWDRRDDVWDAAARDELTASSHRWGEIDLYLGDDGKIHS